MNPSARNAIQNMAVGFQIFLNLNEDISKNTGVVDRWVKSHTGTATTRTGIASSPANKSAV